MNSAHGFNCKGLYSTSNVKYLKPCNAIGEADIVEQVLQGFKVIHKGAWVNHYRCKTIEEYLTVKAKRGWPDNYSNYAKLDIAFFFRCNKYTEEKNEFVKKFMKDN